jgi:hypothetical protein
MGPNGKPIPLDMEAPVYNVEGDASGVQAVRVNCFVSHFTTCTAPNQFSKKKEDQPSLPLGG